MEPVSDLEPGRDLVAYTYESLESFTDGFSPENYVGNTQYGKLYRGQIQKGLETLGVIVKIWVDDSAPYPTTAEHQLSRWQNEIKLLTESDVKSHPNVAKLIGFCSDNGKLGVVYELQAIDSLRNLIRKDDFKWIARIKVALGFARLLEFLHDQGHWLHNISSAHLMVEQNFNPRLVDFSMLVGGVFGGTHHRNEVGSVGHVDPHACEGGGWSDKTDVFAYGVVLLGFIAKRVYDKKDHQRLGQFANVDFWAWVEYSKRTPPKCWPFHKKARIPLFLGDYKERKSVSLVDESLKSDPFFDAHDGVEITKLAMRCVDRWPEQRPTMKEVVCCLRKLKVVNSIGDVLGREEHP
ncbi:probable serine/threonine-protein kinase PBL16 [Rhododendron vialii]|uniref:probable serine/threonine-protein kinase PBL16 n=1 Tax=Rhododendron vialii TaxID=182163 RepID=UPI00265F1C56|nr:probable serine/threonine-protein kinase PBL16 [Rhododendron vialii]